MKKLTLTILSLSIAALSACSADEPTVSENLRKIGAPIEGIWQIADFETCNANLKTQSVIISSDQIDFSTGQDETSYIILEGMKQLKSSRFTIISGELNVNNEKNFRTLAYNDEGDKLVFKGFLVNGKLLKRAELLENYNADGNAKRNMEMLDFNFCSKS